MKTHELLPRDKFDIETAHKLSSCSYSETRPIIPELLTWIQDMNWPVAGPISNYLQTVSEFITDDIINILRGTDDVWKYWTLHVFGLWSSKPIDERLMIEIRRIASNPSLGEQTEEVCEIAQEIVDGL